MSLQVGRPRREQISKDADWPSVWPGAASYRWSTVPLPLRMGWVRRTDMRPPVKAKGNLELVKIPNFLHLTPPAIKRHCEAIKSQWVTAVISDYPITHRGRSRGIL